MPDLFQPTPQELRDRLLRDLRLAAIDAGGDEPPTQPGSDWHILATALAANVLQGYTNINSSETAHSVLDAVGEDLDRIREADGLPEIPASGSSGKIVVTITGPTTIVDGTPFTLPSGLAGQIVGTYVNPADQSELDARSVDTGSATNLAGGATVRFRSPPANVAIDAKVSSSTPLTGGDDGETDPRKRERILNGRRNRPGGANWGQLRQFATEALGSTQDAYVYPAPGGPSSCKVVPVREYDFELGVYTRVMSDAELQVVRSYIQSKCNESEDVVVQACTDQALDVTLKITLPESALSGGNGSGWLDSSPWPPLASGNSVTISTVTANDQLIIAASTTTAPIAGVTRVCWWSSVDRRFYTRLVTAVGGSSGAWEITLDQPFLDSNGDGPSVGEYVSPAAFNSEAYGVQWMKLLNGFGPGENTADSGRLPRAKRRPFVTDEDPISITNTTIAQWSNGLRDPNTGDEVLPGFPEVTAFSLNYASATAPTVPALVSLPPNILVPRHFGIYRL